jgi:hypothetical protein
MDEKIIPLKNIVDELWSGGNPLIDPQIPAVIEAWKRVVPESLRPGITLEGIREGTLHLSVSNPVVGQQFQFLKDSIRGKMNDLLGEPVVKRIRVKAGPPLTLSSSPKKALAVPGGTKGSGG